MKVKLGSEKVPSDYETGFKRAIATYKYQLVYCPEKKKIINLSPPEADLEDFIDPGFIGKMIP
jgi:hypothetical protein